VRPAVGPSDTEIGEELGDAFGGHGRAPIGVDGECSLGDALGGLRLPRISGHLTG
jgi:hypothetical protein